MDESKKTTTGKKNNEFLTRLQQRQQRMKSPREFHEILLRHVVQIRALDVFNVNIGFNPEARREFLKKAHREMLRFIRKFLKAIVDEAGGEVAMVILFQILQNKIKATISLGGGEGGGLAAEFEVEEDEHKHTTTSIFEIIRIDHGKDTAMDIVHDILNDTKMNITTALGYASTEYGDGKVQRECVYYVLRKQHELSHMYRNFVEIALQGGLRGTPSYSIEPGLIAIFMTTTLPNKEDNNNSTTTTLFQNACHRLGRKIVVEIIEDILQQRAASSLSSLSSRSSMNTMRAWMYAATINDAYNNDQTHSSVHVDGFYFLLRRQPDVLLRCSSSSRSNNSSIITSSSNSPASPSEAGMAAAAARDRSHKLADEGCTTSSTIRKRTRMEK